MQKVKVVCLVFSVTRSRCSVVYHFSSLVCESSVIFDASPIFTLLRWCGIQSGVEGVDGLTYSAALGPCPTNCILIQFQIRSNFGVLQLKICLTDHKNFCTCHMSHVVMCAKFRCLWWAEYISNRSTSNVYLISNSIEIPLSWWVAGQYSCIFLMLAVFVSHCLNTLSEVEMVADMQTTFSMSCVNITQPLWLDFAIAILVSIFCDILWMNHIWYYDTKLKIYLKMYSFEVVIVFLAIVLIEYVGCCLQLRQFYDILFTRVLMMMMMGRRITHEKKKKKNLGRLLLTCFDFNPSMDK